MEGRREDGRRECKGEGYERVKRRRKVEERRKRKERKEKREKRKVEREEREKERGGIREDKIEEVLYY